MSIKEDGRMYEDELLKRLAETARQEQEEERSRLDSRWDDLTAGMLPASEVETLRMETGDSAAGRQAYEAFSPLGAGFRARTTTAIRRRLLAADPPSAERTQDQKPPGMPSAGGLWRPWASWVTAAAALAAASLLLVLWPAGKLEPLPPYTDELTGGVQTLRGEDQGEPNSSREPKHFAPGTRFDLVLRPDRRVEGPVSVRAYMLSGQDLRDWQVPIEIDPTTGVVRIAGELGQEIRLPPGETALVVAVGRPGALPTADVLSERLAVLDTVREKAWVAWKRQVILEQETTP